MCCSEGIITTLENGELKKLGPALLTGHECSWYMSFSIVWQQHQLRDEEGVVEPDKQHHADAEPAHGVHHEVQSQLHPSA